MKKTIALLSVIMIMFNFIFASYSQAKQPDDDEERNSTYTQNASLPDDALITPVEGGDNEDNGNNGNNGNDFSFSSLGASIIGFITGIFARLLNVFIALQIDIIMSDLTVTEENRRNTIFLYYR